MLVSDRSTGDPALSGTLIRGQQVVRRVCPEGEPKIDSIYAKKAKCGALVIRRKIEPP